MKNIGPSNPDPLTLTLLRTPPPTMTSGRTLSTAPDLKTKNNHHNMTPWLLICLSIIRSLEIVDKDKDSIFDYEIYN